MKTIIEQEKIKENKELLNLIREDFYRIRPKSRAEFFKEKSDTIPSRSKLRKMFNATYNEILLTAGINENELNNIRRNREEILIKLRKIIEDNERIPKISEINRFGISRTAINREFGSYQNAVKEVVNEDVPIRKSYDITETNEELLQMYIEFSCRIGKGDIGASREDLNTSNEIYNAGVFELRIGGINELRILAGLSPRYQGKIVYSKEDIIQELTKKIISKGDFLTFKEIKEDKELPGTTTILRCFKTTKLSQVNKQMLQIIKEEDFKLYEKLSKN